MGKVKLAVCMVDTLYQERFVKCLMENYKERYEVHLLEEPGQLTNAYDAYVLSEELLEGLDFAEEILGRCLLMDGDNRYKEVYKNMEFLERSIGKISLNSPLTKTAALQVIGISSLSRPAYQLPFAALVAELYGEKKKSIFLDLQGNSGFFQSYEEGKGGLEDIMSMLLSANITRERLRQNIVQGVHWDYICPVRQSLYLKEWNTEMLTKLAELLEKLLGYEILVLNIGEDVWEADKLRESCNEFIWLLEEENNWRQEAYEKEKEKEDGSNPTGNRIHRIQLPSYCGVRSWEQLREKWKWNHIGDKIRSIINQEQEYGGVM